MAQTKIGDPHGLYRVIVGLVDSAGYNMGTAGPNVGTATLIVPYIVRFAQSAEIALPDRTVVDFTGGDVWTGSYVYGITSLGTFQLTLSTVEADLIAMLSDSGVDQTLNTRQTIFGDNIMQATPPQCWMMTVFRLQSKETGSKGANKFLTIVLPRTWVTPKGVAGAPAFQTAGTYGFTIIPTIGDRMPWGPLFSSTALDFSEDEAPNFYIITDYPVHAVGFKPAPDVPADPVTVTLPYKPVPDSTYGTPDSATQPIQVYINGEQTDAASINATTGAISVDAIAADWVAGDYIGIFYETLYEPTA